MTSKCKCKFCDRYKRIKAAVSDLPEDKRLEIMTIWSDTEEDLEAAGTDLSWHEAVIDGSWPSAKEVRQQWIDSWSAIVANQRHIDHVHGLLYFEAQRKAARGCTAKSRLIDQTRIEAVKQ